MFRLNVYAIPFLISSGVFFFFGIYVLKQSPKAALNRTFFGLCMSIFVWLSGISAILSSASDFWAVYSYKILYLGVSFISVSVFTYSAVWLGYARAQKWWILSGYLLGALFTLLFWFTPWIASSVKLHSWGRYSILTPWGGGAYLLFFSVYMTLFFKNLIRGYRTVADPQLKNQIRGVIIAFFVAYFGAIDFLPCYGIEIFPIGAFTTFFLVCTLGYTIIRYRLMNIETVIHKTMVWLLTTFLALAPFGWLIHMTQRWTRGLTPLWESLYFVLILILFYGYYRMVQPRVDHLFQRRQRDLQNVLSEFSKELVHLKSIRDLLQGFVRMARRTFYTRRISIYLLDEAHKELVPAIVKRVRNLKPVSVDHLFLKWLAEQDTVVVDEYVQSDPRVEPFKAEVTEYFQKMDAVVAIPFVLGGKLIGVAHLGKKETLRKYQRQEIYFLNLLKSPVTIALSNSKQFENVADLYTQVQNQNQRLKELDRLKSEFLANTSHELRTPLNGILGLVESILDGADGSLNESQQRHLQMITESGLGLKELISNLLELSRMESGQMKLRVKAFNLANVVDAVAALLEGTARKKGLKLELHKPARLSDCYGDPEKIQRVLMNLVGNAIKFTSEGQVAIQLLESESHIQVRVEDSGIGISEEDQKIIFERFRQVDGSMTRSYEGTGLGLSIVRELVELHGGTIEVQSILKKGSCFSFSLPKSDSELPPQEKRSSLSLDTEAPLGTAKKIDESLGSFGHDRTYQIEKQEKVQQALQGHGETVLVIDDNAINREVVKIRLQINGYQVQECADGVEALEYLKSKEPDLIILDLMMPRMSGYEFCRQVRERSSEDQLPIIMLTAKTEMGDKIYGLSLGANDYISKPFNQEELLARVGVLLKIRKMTRDLKKWNEQLEEMVSQRTAELAKTQGQLIQAEKLATIGTLAGGVAHEINNPLTAVLTNAQILKMTAVGEDLESLSLIEEGAKRCQSIVQKLLKYARQPQAEAGMKSVDLTQVIRNAYSMLHYQLEQDNVDIELDVKGTFLVKGVGNELEQVFTNLIVNARDAVKTSGRPGRIRIRLEDQKQMILAEVSDNGSGIKKEHMGRVFDPFFTTKEVGSGTGLGLAVSQSILQKHKVQVEVKSKENEGTTFALYFKKIEGP